VRPWLLVAVLAAGCAHEVRPIWFRNAPKDWTPPAALQPPACHVRDEVVLEDGTPNGRETIRIECADRTVLVDKRTKRVVKEWRW
jgi:hypothetical protein